MKSANGATRIRESRDSFTMAPPSSREQLADAVAQRLGRHLRRGQRRATDEADAAEYAAAERAAHRAAAFGAREERAPEVGQRDRHHRHRMGLQNLHDAALER